MPRAAALVLVLLLSACGPAMVDADVSRFTSLPPGAPARSFTILPDTSQKGSLEFQHYAEMVADQLARQGWRPLPAGNGADTVVLVHWSLGPPSTATWSEPSATMWGGWGGWGPGPWGAGFYEPYSPYWDTYTRTLWPKMVEVEIVDGPAWRAGDKRMVWQGRAVTDGGVPAIGPAMPYLVQALFTNFPGRNGETVQVRIPEKK